MFGFGLVTLIFAYALVENVIEKPDGIVISGMFIAGMLLISLVSRLSRAAAHAEIFLTSSFWASAASVRRLISSFCWLGDDGGVDAEHGLQKLAEPVGRGQRQTRMMTGMPSETLYHRSLGWHAPALRRAIIVTCVWLIVALVLLPFVTWELATVGGWDAAALTFLMSVWPIIIRAEGSHVEQLATREDETHGSATVLLLAASVASLLGVGVVLNLAGQASGPLQVLFIAVAMLTVVLSWTVVNTVYTLRYAHLYFRPPAEGIDFTDPAAQKRPDYREFAYVAFTIGMTYQVSDTAVRNPRIRRTVLSHALLSYVFGVVIVAGAINLIAGLVR